MATHLLQLRIILSKVVFSELIYKMPEMTNINLSDRSFAAYSEPSNSEPGTEQHSNPPQPQSRTAPGRLEAHDTDSEEEHFNLKKVT